MQTWAVAQLDQPLLANTSYEVQLQGGSAIYHCSCEEREWTTVSTFVTGDAPDDTAPTFSGIGAVRYGELLESASSCGQSKVISVTPEMVAPSDDSRHLYFNVYVDGALEKGYVSSLVHANATDIT